ncbi:caspase recruitment domain-containing protein 8 [Pterocles gutturalis]
MAEQHPAADSPDEFCVFIKTMDDRTFAVPVSLDDSVEELKFRLYALDPSFLPDSTRLIYCGRELENSRTLRDYGITPGCTLYYVQRRKCRVAHGRWCEVVVEMSNISLQESSQWSNVGSPQQGSCGRCMGEDLPEVTPETTQGFWKYCTTYRAHLPHAGIFQCSITGLSFEVKSAVTITYRYTAWDTHLSKADQEMWVPAGPLFHIEVQPGVVQAVRLPHFICLAEDVDTSLCSIAHFKSGEMTLERPTRLIAFSAVLENPSFSLLGVLWRRLRSTLNSFPMHSLVLIFQQLRAAPTTLHFYLIPDDNSVRQAIEQQEMTRNSKLIPKPHPLNPLFFGCIYQVFSTPSVVITPQAQLPFCYKSPKEQQPFIEIYIRNMAEEIWLLMKDTRNNIVVWRASLRSGDINLPARISNTLSGAAFLKKHKTQLCSRMSQLHTILLHLRDANIINSDEEEQVQGQDTSQRKNRFLLELAEKKGREAQEKLHQILKMTDPFLIADLEMPS